MTQDHPPSTTAVRLRRSVLFMPGSNARALDKARSLNADGIIMDLEDAVAPQQKDAAREQIASALAQGGYGLRERIVRVNALDTPWGAADLRAAAQMDTDAVLIPKVQSEDDLKHSIEHLASAGAPSSLRLWAMIETPTGVLNVRQICAASTQLDCLVMGTSDLASALRVTHTTQRTGLLPALGQCVLAAREAGLDILDGVQLDLHDADALQQICHQGCALGFDGKTLIHPRQIEAANNAFSPSAASVQRAQRIVDAWQQASSSGGALVVVDGQLVEHFHVEEAQRVLDIANAITSAIAQTALDACSD